MQIVANKELHLLNVISLRKKMTQIELGKESQNIKKLFDENNLSVKSITSVTYSVTKGQDEKPLLDIELLVEGVANKIPDISLAEYVVKPEIKIVNALYVDYEGSAREIQTAYNTINAYIAEHKLQPITPAYSVSQNPFTSKPESVCMEIYVGISPNVT
ncbi:MAG: hypothetical protein BKP49_04340 [Treponema sp. CETP13]|nr:MAG: hypothetical protein BKP49_04340 [Treponema sp. CETP13]